MSIVRENIEFKRGGQSITKSLDVGRFKNQINWDMNFGKLVNTLQRVITSDNDCIINIGPDSFYMVKNWMDDDFNEEWSPTWRNDDYLIDRSSHLKEWLKQQGAYNLIEYEIIGFKPGWESVTPI